MYPHKLKIHIATTLFFLLALAMLLINIVVIIFWYQHLIQQKINQSRITVAQWNKSISCKNNKSTCQVSEELLQALQNYLNPGCIEILYLTSDGYTGKTGSVDNLELYQLVENALFSKKETIHRLEHTDIPLLFAPKFLAAIFLPETWSGETVAIGILFDTIAIVKTLWPKQSFILLYVLLNAFVLATIGFFRMKRVLLDPVEKLVAVSEAYQVAGGGGLFLDHTDNEIGQLAKAMGNMVQRIEADRDTLSNTVNCLKDTNTRLKEAHHEIIQAEKLATAGRLAAGLAHEIGNPVAIVQGYIELLQQSTLSVEDRLQFTERANNELQRISRLLGQLIDMTRKRQTQKEVIYPGSIIEELLEVLSSSLKQNHITVSSSVSKQPVTILADRELLRQVLLNCLLNSIDAVSEKMAGRRGGEINISLQIRDETEKSFAIIEIKDNGHGIHEDNLHLIFEPFFTTKAPGKGTGLGLAVSYRIIQSFGGQFEVESKQGMGALFRIIMPRYLPNS